MTKVLTAWLTEEVSGETLTETSDPAEAPTRFRVTPARAPLTVFDALVMGTPSTVREASLPVLARVKATLVSFETVKSLAAPEVEETSERRAPVESVTTLAVTPRPWLLMEAASSSRVLLVESEPTLMVTGLPLPTVI